MKPDGEVDTARMVVFNQIALGILPQDDFDDLLPEDIKYICAVKDSVAKAEAAGLKDFILFIPGF